MPPPLERFLLTLAGDLAAPSTLLANVPGSEVPAAFRAAAGDEAVTVHHHDLRAALRAGEPASFGAWPEGGPYESAVIAMPKETARLSLLLAAAASVVVPGGRIVVAGHNDDGIRSAARPMRALGEPHVLGYKFHCRAIAVERGAAAPERGSLGEWIERWTATVRGTAIEVCSMPGTFSAGALDPGTALLLDALELSPEARVLDLGCGSGITGAWLLASGRASACTFTDVDALALAATGATLKANALEGPVIASDVFDAVEGRFTDIVVNVPFHEGRRRSRAAAEAIVAGYRERLEPGGRLWAVASRAVGFERLMPEAEILAETSRFVVVRAG